jgi:3-dehydroquinate dehydratase II
VKSLLLLHGPNLNLLGTREPELYGHTTLEQIDARCAQITQRHGVLCASLQSNAEHVLIDAIHAARGKHQLIVINPGGLTHTSVALRDALLAVAIPFIEVHLSNVHAREAFRRHSYLSDVAIGVICGFGPESYTLAMQAALHQMGAAPHS